MAHKNPGLENSRDQDTGLSARIAKWFIPTATALFVAVGYIVQTAQEDLLGIGSIAHSSTSYIESAALFFRDLVSLPLDVLFGSTSSLLAYWPTLCVIVTAGVILTLPQRAKNIHPMVLKCAAPFVILALLLSKFIVFDVPLSLVQGLILDHSSNLERIVDPLHDVEASPNWNSPIRSAASSRAARLALQVQCSHLGKNGAQSVRTSALRLHESIGENDCNPDNDSARAVAPRAAFTIAVLLQLIISIASVFVLRTEPASPSGVVLALIGLTYGLTLAYDYGKLLRSTSFENGIVKLSSPLTDDDGVSTGNAPLDVEGLILARTESETRILHTNPAGTCPGKDKRPRQTIRMLSLAPSEVVSIGEIESRDIFEWSISSKPDCHLKGEPSL